MPPPLFRSALLAVFLFLTACGVEGPLEEDQLDTAQQPILSSAYLKWAMDPATGEVVIPYVIENTGPVGQTAFDTTRNNILRAMSHWETYARRPDGSQLLRFVPRSGETRWVKFEVKQNNNICYVAPNQTGRTRVDSDPACRWQTFVHEIGHVLTFRHEQKRNDRAGYIHYYADRTTYDDQFDVVSGNALGTGYDTYSIMHYPSCMLASASTCNANTPNAWVVERLTAPKYIRSWTDRPIDQVLSAGDRCAIKRLYGLTCGGNEDAGAPLTETDAGVEDDAGTPPEQCVPSSCSDLGAPCGSFDDGCGGFVNCGVCEDPVTPVDAGAPNVALDDSSDECVPNTCAELEVTCGAATDGCGGLLDCGSCAKALPPEEQEEAPVTGCSATGGATTALALLALNLRRSRRPRT